MDGVLTQGAREGVWLVQDDGGEVGKLLGAKTRLGDAAGGDGVDLLLPRRGSNSGERSLAILGTGQREKGRG